MFTRNRWIWVAFLVAIVAGLASGMRAADDVGTLVGQLYSDRPKVAIHAARQLGSLKPFPRFVVPLLAARLQLSIPGSEDELGRAIVNELHVIGPIARPAVPRIFLWCDGQGPNEWAPGINALRAICPEQTDLIEAINRDRQLHRAAMMALAEVEPETQSEIKWLSAALADRYPEVRIASCRVLSSLRTNAKPAEPELLAALNDPEAGVRAGAINALAALNKRANQETASPPFAEYAPHIFFPSARVVPFLVRALGDGELQVRIAAAHSLRHCDRDAQAAAVPTLIEGLKNPAYRKLAITALYDMGPIAKAAAPALRDVILDRTQARLNMWTTGEAASALYRLASPDVAVPIYFEAWERNTVDQGTILLCLEKCAAQDHVVPFLIHAARNLRPRPDIVDPRQFAIAALGRIRPVDTRAVDALIELAQGDDRSVQQWAMSALASIGTLDSRVMPALVRQALRPDDQGHYHGSQFHWVVRARADRQAIEAIVTATRSPNPELRHAAVLAIGEIGPQAKSAVPALVTCLSDEVESIRNDALIALGRLGPSSIEAVPVLIQQIDTYTGDSWAVPASVLGKIGPEAIPALLARLTQVGPKRRFDADFALMQMGSQAVGAVPELLRLLETTNERLQYDVLRILQSIGLGAAPALEKVALLRDGRLTGKVPSELIQSRCDQTLVAMGEASLDVFFRDLELTEKPRVMRALAGIRLIRCKSRMAAEKITPYLNAGDDELRFLAAETLAVVDGQQRLLAPIVEEMSRHRDGPVRLRAVAMAKSLAKSGQGTWALQELHKLLRDSDELVRLRAACAIAEVGMPQRNDTLKVLTEYLNHKRVAMRGEAATAIVMLLTPTT